MNDNDIKDRLLTAFEWLEEIKGTTPSDENYKNADIIQKFINCYQAEINRQKEDINRLTVELQAMRGSANSYKMHYEDAQAEIEKLQIRNKTLAAITKNYDWKFANAKYEAIKEFAERLKLRFSGTLYCNGGTVARAVDKIIKEMTQEGGGADA